MNNCMLRGISLSLMVAAFAGQAVAGSVNSTAVFERTNQSLYGSGNAAGFDRTYGFSKGWGAQEFAETAGALGQYGYVSGRVEAGQAGLEARFTGTLGSADIKTSYNLTVNHPDQVDRGGRIRLDTGASRLNTPGSNRLAVRGPSLGVQIDAVVDAKGSVGAGARTSLIGPLHANLGNDDFGSDTVRATAIAHNRDVTLVNTGGVQKYNLVNLNNGNLQKSFEVGPGKIDLAAPQGMDASTSFYRNGSLRTEATSSNSVISGTLSIPQAIGQVFRPLQALKADINLLGSRSNPNPPGSNQVAQNPDGTWGNGYAQLKYTIFDATVTAGAALNQTVEFTPVDRLPMLIYSTHGHYYAGFVGDVVEFDAPSLGMPEDVKFIMDVGFGGSLVNSLGAQMNFGLGLEILKMNASVLGYELADVGPLFTDSATTPVNSPFGLYATPAFNVSGFNKHIESFDVHVLPTPGSALLAGLGLLAVSKRRR